MAQQDTKRGQVGTADQRIDPENRSPDEMKYEVAQRGSVGDARKSDATPAKPDAPAKKQTSGYGNREDRENPAAALPQKESGEKPKTQAMSQNGAAIRPSSR